MQVPEERKTSNDTNIEGQIRGKIHETARLAFIEVMIFFINIDGKVKEYENKCTYWKFWWQEDKENTICLFLYSKIEKNKNTNLDRDVREDKIEGFRRQKVGDCFYFQTELIEL